MIQIWIQVLTVYPKAKQDLAKINPKKYSNLRAIKIIIRFLFMLLFFKGKSDTKDSDAEGRSEGNDDESPTDGTSGSLRPKNRVIHKHHILSLIVSF